MTEIREFFTADELHALRRHVERKTRRRQFRSMAGDSQVDGAPCEYADPVAERLLSVKTSYLCELLNLDLVPTYTYIRLYRPGDRLAAHRDRPACEITVSASLAADAEWPIRILTAEGVVPSCPPPGGAVVFRGHELLHWRDPLCGRRRIASVLFHYVQRHGPCRSWSYDRRRDVSEWTMSAPC
jgi:alkylated DNA repair dioxygenase AlkB